LNQPAYNQKRGVLAALGAFGAWGLFPVYFKLIGAAPPLEIITHRILWSIPLLAGFLLLRDGLRFWHRLKLPLHTMAMLGVSSLLIAANWLIFVWAVNEGHVLATSMGYFITPLVNVLLGYVFLKEELTPIQTFAVVVAAAGTIYLAWYLGVTPWISLALAFTFAFYALVRKKLLVGPMIGLLWETMLLALPAIIYLFWADSHGGLAFAHHSLKLDVLLALCGVVTVLPLVWFNVAAKNMDLSTVGFFQYLSPTITFLLAVFLYGEEFTQGHVVAFSCIWVALALVSSESFARMRKAAAK